MRQNHAREALFVGEAEEFQQEGGSNQAHVLNVNVEMCPC
jgi:hypothetical protein